jgi:hypothetical protein
LRTAGCVGFTALAAATRAGPPLRLVLGRVASGEKPVEQPDSVVIRFAGDSGDGMQLTGAASPRRRRWRGTTSRRS